MKCALVTGGSRGIGSAICQKLAIDTDYHILINYQSNKDAAEETLKKVIEAGNTGEIIANDTSRQRLYRLQSIVKQQHVTNVKISVQKGEFLTIVGKSGCGHVRFILFDEKIANNSCLYNVLNGRNSAPDITVC